MRIAGPRGGVRNFGGCRRRRKGKVAAALLGVKEKKGPVVVGSISNYLVFQFLQGRQLVGRQTAVLQSAVVHGLLHSRTSSCSSSSRCSRFLLRLILIVTTAQRVETKGCPTTAEDGRHYHCTTLLRACVRACVRTIGTCRASFAFLRFAHAGPPRIYLFRRELGWNNEAWTVAQAEAIKFFQEKYSLASALVDLAPKPFSGFIFILSILAASLRARRPYDGGQLDTNTKSVSAPILPGKINLKKIQNHSAFSSSLSSFIVLRAC